MKSIVTILLLFVASPMLMSQTVVSNQAEWDELITAGRISSSVGDVIVLESATIVEDDIIEIFVKITNYGTITFGNNVLISGDYTNAGTTTSPNGLSVEDAAIFNTGTINAEVELSFGTVVEIYSCDELEFFTEGMMATVENNVAVGTVCTDGDITTTDDQIIDDNCTCAGTAPIPSASEWALLILSLILSAMGLVFLGQKRMLTTNS